MSTAEFSLLLTENADFLKPFAINLTKDHETAKDLFQETLYRALSNKDKYNVGTNIKAWLYTIMRNIFINDYRKRAKQSVVLDNSPNDFLIDQTRTKVLNDGVTNLNLREVKQLIYELPELFRTPFNLYFEGYKYNEIADELNEPLGTIKSRIHFARKILKQKIQRY
ncbi:MAG: RNA polymerase sigma factor [Chitinophagia bacterium]|jgi:RNA polymerase sigma-70 factor (ECF subfamily)|nr:RNA polymerase sigma factor [Chitinophagia bacterium]NCA30072.1 RNA polymerase sigma factor [Chitinophagia bacterium]